MCVKVSLHYRTILKTPIPVLEQLRGEDYTFLGLFFETDNRIKKGGTKCPIRYEAIQ